MRSSQRGTSPADATAPRRGLPAAGPVGGRERLLAALLALVQPPLERRHRGHEGREEDDDDEPGVRDDLVVGLAVRSLAAVVRERERSEQGEEQEARGQRGDEAAHASERIDRVPGIQRSRPQRGTELLRLDRPDRRNALDSATLHEILEALDDLAADEDLRVLVFSTTSERALCAGADVAEELDRAGGIARMEAFGRFYAAIEAFPVPTIAVCVGNCVGAGAELVAGCDLRVGGDNLKLAWAGAKLGVPVGVARLVPLVGLARAKDLVFTGRTVGMEEAQAIGLLQRTAPAAEAEAAALDLAAELADRPPDGMRLLKRMFREFEATADRVARENLLLEAFQREGAGLPQG